ncbi:hypothetical protein OG895_18370 [Streptomyces sp. NBC_00201]|uniref:hypothetical protein n=1 Tax=Streptomyces sp. NBC_00201 TaxID=2975679 RepID=UPI00224CB403|nr:hypothetical protein [Streptomyces sp. NBC_00201]MCX5247164.1 hypothetical protein [Streptomyces sp. NBC_00201]
MRMTEQVRTLMQDADPARSVISDAGRKQTGLEHILDSAQHALDRPGGKRRRPTWRVAILASTLAVVGGTAALAVVARKPAPPAPVTSILCATDFSFFHSPGFVTDLGDAVTPEEACRAQWPRSVGQQSTGGMSSRSAPAHLVACVAEASSGLITVYPRPADLTDAQACGVLGLVRPPDGPIYAGATLVQVSQLQHRIDARLGAASRRKPYAPCASYASVHAAVQSSLRETGLDRWRVDDQRSSRSDTGVWYYLDARAGTVVLYNPAYCSTHTSYR